MSTLDDNRQNITLDHSGGYLEASLNKATGILKDNAATAMEDHTAQTEDVDYSEEHDGGGGSTSSSSYDHQILAKFLGHDSFTNSNNSTQNHQPLHPVDEDEESDSELTLEDEYNFEDVDHHSLDSSSPRRGGSNHSHSLQNLSLHSKYSAHSTNSQASNSSLKVFRKTSVDWKTSGHDSLSFLESFDDVEDSTEVEDDDLRVLCSRDSKRLKLLGEGAFGQVWLVRHNHKSYALKVCAKYDLITEGAVHEVVREREIMSQLDHPFICHLWATNQDSDFVYMLEDYLAGGELYGVLERQPNGRLTPSQAQVYTACIADALEYLHSRHIVYRDLKPENIMLSKRGFPTLIDFGCAKKLQAENDYQSMTLCGTPRFASPEMIDPESFGGKGHGIATDHWALGILLYEMLAGENPFWYEGMPDGELYDQIPVVRADFSPFEKLNTPQEAVDLIQRLLIKDPAERISCQGNEKISEHAWLSPVDVKHLGRIKAPWVPDLTDPTDTHYFDDWEDQIEDRFAQSYPTLTSKEEAHFADF